MFLWTNFPNLERIRFSEAVPEAVRICGCLTRKKLRAHYPLSKEDFFLYLQVPYWISRWNNVCDTRMRAENLPLDFDEQASYAKNKSRASFVEEGAGSSCVWIKGQLFKIHASKMRKDSASVLISKLQSWQLSFRWHGCTFEERRNCCCKLWWKFL